MMTSKMPKRLRYWEITREVGMWRFILQKGLGWGAFMFGVNLLLSTPLRYSILVTLGVWLTGGVIVAVFMWVSSEREYRRYVDPEVKAPEASPCD